MFDFGSGYNDSLLLIIITSYIPSPCFKSEVTSIVDTLSASGQV